MRVPRIFLLLLLTPAVLLTLAAPSGAGAGAAVGVRASAEGRGPARHQPYELLQLNLCLSGLAGCFGGTEYPKVVDEAIDTIQAEDPDTVTVNEACSGDIQRIAEETGYDYEFATVIYRGEPLPCRNPGDRGVFGNAILARGEIESAEDEPFEAQLGSEERRWLCVVTDAGVRVCTTHLSVAGSDEQAATNDAQCEELAVLLRQDGQPQPTILAGDVNRQGSCAPPAFWTLTDAEATQAPGIQHAYGSRAWLIRPEVEILPMEYTDHDALLVRALLRQSGTPTTGPRA